MQNQNINKVLIIRLGAIGDVVHTSALFHAIKKQYPDTIIHYLTSELIKPLIIEDKALGKVLTINPKFKLFSGETINLIKEVKKEKYDAVINLQPSLKTKIIVKLANIRNVSNYRKTFKLHAVKNFWQTGLKLFPDIKEEESLKLFLPSGVIENAKEILKNYKRPYFVINAGGILSKRQGRTYPVEKWIQLGNKLREKYDGTIILNGAKEDKDLLAPLNIINNSVNLIGELPLIDSVGVISLADYMISGDSGPLHIATALNVKSVGLYGSMPINRTGCYSNGINIKSDKKCVPCNRRKCKYLKKTHKLYAPCMEEIDVNTILETLEKL